MILQVGESILLVRKFDRKGERERDGKSMYGMSGWNFTS